MIETTTYLGPATVLGHTDEGIRIRLPHGEEATSRLALVIPYEPVPGDQLLVITQDGHDYYTIGVLKGAGKTTLQVPGDLEIHAPHGRIDLSSARGIKIQTSESLEGEARRMTWRAGKFELIAERVLQRATDVYHWIAGLLQTKSQRMRTVVDTQLHLQANEAHLRTTGDMNIDGKTINLG